MSNDLDTWKNTFANLSIAGGVGTLRFVSIFGLGL